MLENRRIAVAAFILLIIFWGSAFAAIEVGLRYSPPLLFAGIRTIIGGLALLPVALVWGGSPSLRRQWPVYALLVVFNVVLFFGPQTLAVLYLPSGSVAVLIYLQPILVGLLAWLFLSEPLPPAKVAGLFLGFLGIAVVSAGGFFGAMPPGASAGIAFGIASAFSWAIGTVYFKRAQERVSTLWAVTLPFFAGGVVLTVLGLVMESPRDIAWTGTFVGSLLYAAIVGNSFAWLLWLGLIRAGEASRVAAYVFFVPLVAVLVGTVFLDEALRLSLIASGTLIVTGIYLVNKQSAVSRQPSAKSKDSQAGR